MSELLPKNSTALERALADIAYEFSNNADLLTVWNAQTCPTALLPYLAWALSVDEWDDTWGVDRKRKAIADAKEIHQHKGTVYGIKRALAVLGQPNAQVIERSDYIKYNGAANYNAYSIHKGQAGWPSFRVVLLNPITIDQAQIIYRTLESVKRFCVKLVAVDFTQAALRHSGKQTYNGAYSHGTV